MSILIDKVERMKNTQTKVKGKWYIAKSLPNTTLKNKIKDCIKILTDKAIAVHFKEDEED